MGWPDTVRVRTRDLLIGPQSAGIVPTSPASPLVPDCGATWPGWSVSWDNVPVGVRPDTRPPWSESRRPEPPSIRCNHLETPGGGGGAGGPEAPEAAGVELPRVGEVPLPLHVLLQALDLRRLPGAGCLVYLIPVVPFFLEGNWHNLTWIKNCKKNW